MEPIRRWWRQPDRYEWLSEYVESQQLRGTLQAVLAITVTVLGFVPIIMLWSPTVPTGPATISIAVAATTLCWTMAVAWLVRWPTRRASRVFALLSAICVSAACLIALTPQHGLTACVIFAAISGLVGFTHTSPFLSIVLFISVGTTAACGWRAAADGDPAIAVSEMLLVLVSILTVPMVGQVLVQLLGADAVNSDVDALTGLHNRRGFHRAVGDRAARRVREHGALGVVMVDLDDFKRVNDTEGHAAGDRLLTAVAAALRKVAGGDAVVARIGGEEFCIAATMTEQNLRHLGDRVRKAIEALPGFITASVGTATSAPVPATQDAIDQLLGSADTAMYSAKRAGGNRVHHAADLPAAARTPGDGERPT